MMRPLCLLSLVLHFKIACNALLSCRPALTAHPHLRAPVITSHSNIGSAIRAAVPAMAIAKVTVRSARLSSLSPVNVASDKLMVAKKKSARSSSHQCKDPECTGTYASFGYTADRKRCEFPSCSDEAIFGRANTNEVQYCDLHKQDEMTCNAARRCQQSNCTKHANFGLEADKASMEMWLSEEVSSAAAMRLVAFQPALDIAASALYTHKLCQHKGGRDVRPSYGFKKDGIAPQTPERCPQHKLPGMVDVKGNWCRKCKRRIIRGYKLIGDRRVSWCEKCKPDNAVPGRPKRNTTANAA
eukprot:15628-Heterococcus_DN1.PRE.3